MHPNQTISDPPPNRLHISSKDHPTTVTYSKPMLVSLLYSFITKNLLILDVTKAEFKLMTPGNPCKNKAPPEADTERQRFEAGKNNYSQLKDG